MPEQALEVRLERSGLPVERLSPRLRERTSIEVYCLLGAIFNFKELTPQDVSLGPSRGRNGPRGQIAGRQMISPHAGL